MLMKYYLDDNFRPEYPELVASIDAEDYYIRMVVAWYFETALAKQYDAIRICKGILITKEGS